MRYLYTNGCSVTYGYGLDPASRDDPQDAGAQETICLRFGALVAAKVGLTEKNHAKPGGSNDRIVRTTVRDVCAHQGTFGFGLIGITSPLRSEIRFNERYVRMFFGQASSRDRRPEDLEGFNRFFFEQDTTRNEFFARDYLSYCGAIVRHSYDEMYLAEKLLTQILLLQQFFRGHGVPALLVPILDISIASVIRLQLKSLIDAVDASRFLHFREAIEDGWCAVGECQARGVEMYKGHPLRAGHALIAERILAAIDLGALTQVSGKGMVE